MNWKSCSEWTAETLGCKYLIKGKAYPTLLANLTDVYHLFTAGIQTEDSLSPGF